MKQLDVLEDAFSILMFGKAPKVLEIPVCEPHGFECQVDAELYPKLALDGWINCEIEEQDGEVWISKHELKVKDKNGQDVAIDWDDLLPRAQKKIEDQITRAYHETRIAA